MAHVLSMFDSDYLHHYDLPTEEYVVEIERCEAVELTGHGGKKQHKPILFFVGHRKGLVLNRTNSGVLMHLYGPEVTVWPGHRVTLYKTTTELAGQTVECIRIRPTAPKEKK